MRERERESEIKEKRKERIRESVREKKRGGYREKKEKKELSCMMLMYQSGL